MTVTFGSKAAEDLARDLSQTEHNPSHPNQSPARTTFFSRDAPAGKQKKWKKLWRLQHGFAHTYEGWGGQRFREEDMYTYRRARTILSQTEVPKLFREPVARRVVEKDVRGFSSHYAGADGATLGFAALRLYDSAEAAADSRLADFADEELGINGGALMEYTFGRSR